MSLKQKLHRRDIQRNKKRIDALFAAMSPIQGEVRAIQKCGDCGHLFGRRYVPFGLGMGLTIDACWCQLTAHRPAHEVTRREP